MTEPTHIDVGVEELCPGVARQHVDDDHLAPLLHVDQEVAQFPVVLVDQVDPLRAHLLKGHDHAACHQLWCSETGVQYSETRLFAGNRIVKLSQSFSVATICHDLEVKGGWLREAAQSLIGVHFVSLGQFVSRKYEGGKKKKPPQTLTVVLSARSFSMTSISWSFCSGSRLRIHNGRHNLDSSVRIFLPEQETKIGP